MSPEEALIRGVEADPAADLPRLVYADWLDENGREPFADFLRTELELAKLQLDSPDAPPLRERLWQAWVAVDAEWLHRFTQPRMLRANPTPFPAAWPGRDLGEMRTEPNPPHGGYDYHRLPPIRADEFLGTFDYLGPPPPLTERQAQRAEEWQQRWGGYQRQARESAVRLPPAFIEFMSHPTLRYAIGDPHCFFTFRSKSFAFRSEEPPIRPAKSGEAVHALFYADGRLDMCWDLFAHPSGAYCVILRDADHFHPRSHGGVWFVAPSFEAFVYRDWLEYQVHLWSRQGEPQPPAIQAYIDHYRTQANGGT